MRAILVVRTALVLAWLTIMAVTVHAISTQGLSAGSVFITDFSHPWRAQINGDFGLHLLLIMAWIAYRERGVRRLLALPVVLGSVYTLPYLFAATFKVKPDA
ncbi:hypothetical protein ACFTSF_06105 [Kribbella sp. NPDC056951]|uniref:hypothetical protein n=1 Tax=Kribbella sp. NPDC056951 TaxID=3345978 RepID=UPI0036381624